MENNDDDTRNLFKPVFLEQDMAVLSRTMPPMTRRFVPRKPINDIRPQRRDLSANLISASSPQPSPHHFTFQHSAQPSSVVHLSRNHHVKLRIRGPEVTDNDVSTLVLMIPSTYDLNLLVVLNYSQL